MMDRTFLTQLLAFDSTTGSEKNAREFLIQNFTSLGASVLEQKVTETQFNLYFYWGNPEIVFCAHQDTVPPYYVADSDEHTVYGRGACDAKGQIAVIYALVQELRSLGESNFGVLLTVREESDSKGAQKANELPNSSRYLIVCEPTQNLMISATKGTALFSLKTLGSAAHSGYPEAGKDAVARFCAFREELKKYHFPQDHELGEVTYNFGHLRADNAANVLADEVKAELFFRTTFAAEETVLRLKDLFAKDDLLLELVKSTHPYRFATLEGFKTGVAAFTTDAPWLTAWGKPFLLGPGSILDAHTMHEQLLWDDFCCGQKLLKQLYFKLKIHTL